VSPLLLGDPPLRTPPTNRDGNWPEVWRAFFLAIKKVFEVLVDLPFLVTGAAPDFPNAQNLGLAWTVVPFNAADFSSDVGTWVVQAGDLVSFGYRLIGTTMIIRLETMTTTVTGTPLILQVKIPGGKLAAVQQTNSAIYSDNGTFGTGLVQSTVGGALLRCFIQTLGAWQNAANTTFVRFTATIEVQP